MPDPHASQARIGLADNPAATIGCGVLVSPQHIVTCAHVVAEALGDPLLGAVAEAPERAVPLSLPLLSAPLQTTGRVVCWQRARDDGRKGPEDIAVLELAEPAPAEAEPAPLAALAAADYTALAVHCFGFPRHIDEGVRRIGTCRGENTLGRVQLDIARGLVEGGFSGTGAWDPARGAVIGLVVAARTEEQSAQLIPVRTLFAACPALDRAWRPRNPYKGLSAFEPADRADFFGRAALVQALAARVQSEPLVTLIGPSGSGKSSLIGAGLLPLLADAGGWRVLRLRPGGEPFDALAGALVQPGLTAGQRVEERRRLLALLRDDPDGLRAILREWLADAPDERLLLVVDQLEELFTNAEARDPAQARAFAEALTAVSVARPDTSSAVALPAHLLLALRADFMGWCMEGAAAPFVAPEHQFQVGPLDGDDLRAAIEAPAAALGVRFEPGVTDTMLAELRDEPGRLPLLQFALTELWERQQARRIDAAALRDIGGVRRALSDYADRVIDDLSEADRTRARRILVQLVRPAEHEAAPGTRQVASLRRIPEQDRALLPRLAASRLVVTGSGPDDEPRAEIAHEALISEWGRLRSWVDEDRAFRLWQEGLRSRLADWDAHARDAGYLLAGPPLAEAEARLTGAPAQLSDEDRTFIAVSRRYAQRRRRQARTAVAAIVMGLTVLAAGAGWQWQRAERAAAAERATADLAVAQRLATTAEKVFEENPGETGLAAMLAVESQARRNTPEANGLLRRILSLTPGNAPRPNPPWGISKLQISDGGRVEVRENNQRWGSCDQAGGAFSSVALLRGSDLASLSTRRFGGLVQPMISPDGRWLAVAGDGRHLTINDLESGEVVLDEATRSAGYAVFAPDSRTLYVAKPTGVIDVRAAPDWSVRRQLRFPLNEDLLLGTALDITADGSRLLLSWDWTGDGVTRGMAIVVPTDGSRPQPLDLRIDDFKPTLVANVLASAQVAPTGHGALTQQRTGQTKLWDLETGAMLYEVDDETHGYLAEFSADGTLVASANWRGTIFVRRVANGKLIHRLQHLEDSDVGETSMSGLAFSIENALLASAGTDGSIVIWNLPDGSLRHRLQHDAPVVDLVVDPADGTTLLAGTEAGVLIRYDMADGTALAQRQLDGAINKIAVGSNPQRIAISLQETPARVCWHDISFVDRGTGNPISYITWNGSLLGQTVSPDGSRFAARDFAHDEVHVWDTSTGRSLLTHADKGEPIAFSPDSRRLLLHSFGQPLRVLDVATGETLHELGEPGGVEAVFAGSFNDFVVTRGFDGSLRVWDLSTGANWQVPRQGKSPGLLNADGSVYARSREDGTEIEIVETRSGTRIGVVDAGGATALAVNADGSRLLTRRPIAASAEAPRRGVEIAGWDVHSGALMYTRVIEIPVVRVLHAGNGLLGLSFGPATQPDGKVISGLDFTNWDNGRVMWSLRTPIPSLHRISAIDTARDRVLIQGQGFEMRSLSGGALIWDRPYSSLRAAAFVPGTDLVVLALKDADGERAVEIVDQMTGVAVHRFALSGTTDVVASVDGERLIVAVWTDRWRGLRIWTIDNGESVKDIELHRAPVRLLPLTNPDRVGVRYADGTLEVIDLVNGREVQRIAHLRSAAKVAYAQDGDRAVTSTGPSVRVWDARDGTEVAHRITHGDAESLAVSKDGTRVVYLTDRPRTAEDGTEYRTAVVWLPDSGRAPLMFPADDLGRIDIDPTGSYLVLHGGQGRSVRIIDAQTLSTRFTVRPLRSGKLEDVFFSGDGRTVLVEDRGSYPDPQGGRQESTSLRAFELGTGVESMRVDKGPAVVPVPGTAEIRLQSERRRWHRFDLEATQLDRVLTRADGHRLRGAHRSPRVLASSWSHGAFLADTDGGQVITLLRDDGPHEVRAGTIDPTGRFVALSRFQWRQPANSAPGVRIATENEIAVYDALSGRALAATPTDRGMEAVEFLPDTDTLIACAEGPGEPADLAQELLFWHWRTDQTVVLVADNPVRRIAVASDGKHFASAEGSRLSNPARTSVIGTFQVRLWSSEDGTEAARFPIDFAPTLLAISPDGSHVAVGDYNRVLLLRSDDGSELIRFETAGTASVGKNDRRIEWNAPGAGGRKLAFANHGRTLVAAEQGGALLFDIPDRSYRRISEPEANGHLVISPDGRLMATRDDAVIAVWDVASGEQLTRFALSGVKDLTFGGANGRALIAEREGEIHQLVWQPEQLKQLACERFGDGEWRRARARVIRETGQHPCDAATTSRTR